MDDIRSLIDEAVESGIAAANAATSYDETDNNPSSSVDDSAGSDKDLGENNETNNDNFDPNEETANAELSNNGTQTDVVSDDVNQIESQPQSQTTTTTTATATTAKKKTVVITLSQLLIELDMVPSQNHNKDGKWIGKGARNERELLRFYTHVGVLHHTRTKAWQWTSPDEDDQIAIVKRILLKFKNEKLRSPARSNRKWDQLQHARENGLSQWSKYSV